MKKVFRKMVLIVLISLIVTSLGNYSAEAYEGLSMMGEGVYVSSNVVQINEVNFPSQLFREYVRTNFDKNLDGQLSSDEIQGATEINLNAGNDIGSIKGIEHLTALKKLICQGNGLVNMDLSKNTELEYLDCYGNMLQSLDLSSNKKLTFLDCSRNNFPNLDLSNNTELKELTCGFYCGPSSNVLRYLDISKNAKLQKLEVTGEFNQIDFTKNVALKEVYYQNANGYYLDFSGCKDLEELHCGAKAINISNNTKLLELTCSGIDNIDVSNNTQLRKLTVLGTNISDLDLRNNKELVYLNIDRCDNLKQIDLSNNVNLNKLSCVCNSLTILDLSNNTKLYDLECWNGMLEKIIFSADSRIGKIDCRNNKISYMNLSDCEYLFQVVCADNQLTELDVSNSSILQNIWCSGNNIKELDVSNNSKLFTLYCYDNNIGHIDLTNNPELSLLSCGNNNISNINVSNNRKLSFLSCVNLPITELDVTKNTELKSLFISDTQISNIDLSNNILLEELDYHNTNLIDVDLSNNKALKKIVTNESNNEQPFPGIEDNNNGEGNGDNGDEINDKTDNTGENCDGNSCEIGINEERVLISDVKYNSNYSADMVSITYDLGQVNGLVLLELENEVGETSRKIAIYENNKIKTKIYETSKVYVIGGVTAFNDITQFEDMNNHWAISGVSKAVQIGLFKGTSANRFSPDNKITREQMWMVLSRLCGEKLITMDQAQSWIVDNNISDGMYPKGIVSREQFVTLLWRTLGKPTSNYDLSEYSDYYSISDYAKEAFAWAVEIGLVNGTSPNTLDPQGYTTRAQIATIFERYIWD